MPGHEGRITAYPKGVSQHDFAQSARADIQRSVFNRSCGLKTTFSSGDLVPIFVDEALPGDTLTLRTASFARMATPIFPVMDNFFMDFFFFAVPIRLVWDNWQKFNGEQVDPGDSTDFLVPTMTETPAELSLSDYFGIPIGNSLTFSSLWHRAFNLIWNEWFRDENLQDSVVVDKDDGPDTPGDYVILKRGKRHDYFTSCLPFAQKGDPVELSFGGTAPVALDNIIGTGDPTFDVQSATRVLAGASTFAAWNPATTGTGDATWVDPQLGGTGVADLSAATGQTINAIREAFQIQRLLERDARGGTQTAHQDEQTQARNSQTESTSRTSDSNPADR